ncbi:hypothetical protein QMO56_02315 [Roseomonas sp. E05]|uniref:hypothetical protein n=1 Tax=Roseomonas sp. E05 TaxID=3046310 RepID=UPI0024B909C5|nr:hypothetical protein [Roseomonas sp. E05]MDJ0386935.1 hypothetical protein [Roseomonas sp. E05]
MRGTAWRARDLLAAEEASWAMPPGLACVVDVSLSLAPGGLHWAMALAENVPTWLPQGHWTLVEGVDTYRAHPRVRRRLGGATGQAGAAAFTRAANEWRHARDTLNLEGACNFYWILGSWSGSVTPKENDPLLIARHDALASGLDALAGLEPGAEALSGRRNLLDLAAIAARGGPGGRPPRPDILADCARDALALAAALNGPRPMLLVAMRKEEAQPWLVDRLERAHVPCARLEDGPWREAMRRRLHPLLLASGLAVPIAGGLLRLAAMAVAAPRARCTRAEGMLDWNAGTAATAKASWENACAIWWEVP